MEMIRLGRTGVVTTAAGLGCGGFSRLGIKEKGIFHAASIVRTAYLLGIRFFDTAQAYGTEEAVGMGLEGEWRENCIISTKFIYRPFGGAAEAPSGEMITPETLENTLNESLKKLKTDYIDIWNVHALVKEDINRMMDALYPVMVKAKERGKVRFLGVTEQFAADTSHEMLKKILPLDAFDVVMTGYNILNPSAKSEVLPKCAELDVATLCMFAVRRALNDKEWLKTELERIKERGQGGFDAADAELLDFIVETGAARSLQEAAYRFARYTDGISVTLTGTGHAGHLVENVIAMEKPPLDAETLSRLNRLFGDVDCVSGQ